MAVENTDREIWRAREGDAYADSIHVTKMGGIGVNCGGHVIVKSIRAWHELAQKPQRYDIGKDQMIEVTQEWVDSVQKQFLALGRARSAARDALLLVRDGKVGAVPELQEFLDAWMPNFL